MTYRCTCKDSNYDSCDDYELPLPAGRHTIVTPMRCEKCHRFTFFPEANWDLWLKEGNQAKVQEIEKAFEKVANWYTLKSRVQRFFKNLVSLP